MNDANDSSGQRIPFKGAPESDEFIDATIDKAQSFWRNHLVASSFLVFGGVISLFAETQPGVVAGWVFWIAMTVGGAWMYAALYRWTWSKLTRSALVGVWVIVCLTLYGAFSPP